MTVNEIKAKVPEAEIYELSPYFKYIICLKSNAMSGRQISDFMETLQNQGISAIIVSHHPNVDAPRLLEIKE